MLCVLGLLMLAQSPDISLWQQVLTRHVVDGGDVRYAALKADMAPLNGFVEQMAAVSPESHPALFATREATLAYWINAYNSLVLWAITQEYPAHAKRLESEEGRQWLFHTKQFTLGGRGRTLASIENDILRARHREPRIHFAIVCASKGCPWLSREAYTAENVERKLDEETRRFLGQERNLRLDRARGEIVISSIFEWYGEDFGRTEAERIAFLARYRPAEAQQLRAGRWRFRYLEWDWSLNDASR